MPQFLLLRSISRKYSLSRGLKRAELCELEDAGVSSTKNVLICRQAPVNKRPKAQRILTERSCRQNNRKQLLWPVAQVTCSMASILLRRVPRGYLPVSVEGRGESKLYLIKAKHLNHPLFLDLLELTAQEYGYSQQGILKFVCDVELFEKALASLSREHRGRATTSASQSFKLQYLSAVLLAQPATK